jgi:hypothetical protein
MCLSKLEQIMYKVYAVKKSKQIRTFQNLDQIL